MNIRKLEDTSAFKISEVYKQNKKEIDKMSKEGAYLMEIHEKYFSHICLYTHFTVLIKRLGIHMGNDNMPKGRKKREIFKVYSKYRNKIIKAFKEGASLREIYNKYFTDICKWQYFYCIPEILDDYRPNKVSIKEKIVETYDKNKEAIENMKKDEKVTKRQIYVKFFLFTSYNNFRRTYNIL